MGGRLRDALLPRNLPPMEDEEQRILEDYIQDWFWDERSHRFARDLGGYLLGFMEHIREEELSERTRRKYCNYCWFVGKLECDYGYRKKFSPAQTFAFPRSSYEHEFKRKHIDSKYTLDAYRATWKKLHVYTQAKGYIAGPAEGEPQEIAVAAFDPKREVTKY